MSSGSQLFAKLVHDSYQCPRWLEYLLVYCGVQVGLVWALRLPEDLPYRKELRYVGRTSRPTPLAHRAEENASETRLQLQRLRDLACRETALVTSSDFCG